MKSKMTLIALLAIFMLAISAGVAFAEDTAGDNNETDDIIDDNTPDDDSETNDTEDDQNETYEDDISPVNDTENYEMLTSSTYDEPANATGNASGSASGGDEAASSSNLSKNTTANPILVLMAAIAGAGLMSFKIRK